MKIDFTKRFIKLVFGLFLCSVGLVFIINGNIGMDAWNGFHNGISLHTGIKIGYVSILTAIIVFFIAALAGEKFGVGIIADSILIGLFMQIILDANIVPIQNSILMGIIYILIGIEFLCIGNIFYMGAALGAGPRDSFTLAMAKKTGLKHGHMRVVVEIVVLVFAFLLGGKLGLGTIITTLGTGSIMQLNMDLLKFDAKKIKHESFLESVERFR